MIHKTTRKSASLAIALALSLGLATAGYCTPPPASGVNENLSSTTKSLTPNSHLVGASITVGGNTVHITATTKLTPAEAAAAYEYLHGGQTLQIGTLGNATGGSLKIGNKLDGLSLTGLVIPTGVTAIRNFGTSGALNLSGVLSNSGTLFAISTNPSVQVANISASSIYNAPGALITSIVPLSGLPGYCRESLVSNLSLNFTTAPSGSFVNYGRVISANNMSISSPLIVNSTGNSCSPTATIQAVHNLTLLTQHLINDDLIQANRLTIDNMLAAQQLLISGDGTLSGKDGIDIESASSANITQDTLCGVLTGVAHAGDLEISIMGHSGLTTGDLTADGGSIEVDVKHGFLTVEKHSKIKASNNVELKASKDITIGEDSAITAGELAAGFSVDPEHPQLLSAGSVAQNGHVYLISTKGSIFLKDSVKINAFGGKTDADGKTPAGDILLRAKQNIVASPCDQLNAWGGDVGLVSGKSALLDGVDITAVAKASDQGGILKTLGNGEVIPQSVGGNVGIVTGDAKYDIFGKLDQIERTRTDKNQIHSNLDLACKNDVDVNHGGILDFSSSRRSQPIVACDEFNADSGVIFIYQHSDRSESSCDQDKSSDNNSLVLLGSQITALGERPIHPSPTPAPGDISNPHGSSHSSSQTTPHLTITCNGAIPEKTPAMFNFGYFHEVLGTDINKRRPRVCYDPKKNILKLGCAEDNYFCPDAFETGSETSSQNSAGSTSTAAGPSDLSPVAYRHPDPSPITTRSTQLNLLKSASADLYHTGALLIYEGENNTLPFVGGQALINTRSTTILLLPSRVKATLAPNTTVLVTASASGTKIAVLVDQHKDSVKVSVDDRVIASPACGKEIIICPIGNVARLQKDEFSRRESQITPMPDQMTLVSSEISPYMVLAKCDILRKLGKTDKANHDAISLRQQILKMAACIGIVTNKRGPYNVFQ